MVKSFVGHKFWRFPFVSFKKHPSSSWEVTLSVITISALYTFPGGFFFSKSVSRRKREKSEWVQGWKREEQGRVSRVVMQRRPRLGRQGQGCDAGAGGGSLQAALQPATQTHPALSSLQPSVHLQLQAHPHSAIWGKLSTCRPASAATRLEPRWDLLQLFSAGSTVSANQPTFCNNASYCTQSTILAYFWVSILSMPKIDFGTSYRFQQSSWQLPLCYE